MNNKLQEQARKEVEKLEIQGIEVPFFIVSGSHLYGTANENSDIDFRGVFIEMIDRRIGFGYREELTFSDDGKLFDIKKFIALLRDNNPNIMEWLFAPRSNIFRLDPDFKNIVFQDKQQFVNPYRIQKKFLGYCMSEMSRLKKLNGKTGEKRRSVIEKYGYNTKSASNVMRIACGGIDLCSHFHLNLPYENKDLLKDIKNGKYTFDEFMTIAMPKVEKLRLLKNLKDRSEEISEFSERVLVDYIKLKAKQNGF